ncbi:MAG: hypothetical protein R8J84_00960 [Mariprofundales bacterium]
MVKSHAIEHHLQPFANALPLTRRGQSLGWITPRPIPLQSSSNSHREQWDKTEAVLLPGAVLADSDRYQQAIDTSHALMVHLVEGGTFVDMIDQEPCYRQRLNAHFSLSTVSSEDHDQQAIEKLYFLPDTNDDDEVWCKASWLSFHPDDASLRFRFSFGIEGVEDVAADPARQTLAADLCQRLFPESALVTENLPLQTILTETLNLPAVDFFERIVYFNAPNGGAQMHHDVERGHVGVIYAQISGSTFWLALSKQKLMRELRAFSTSHPQTVTSILPDPEQCAELQCLCNHPEQMAAQLNQAEHELLEAVIDHSPEFIHHLTSGGYGYLLAPGDALLMPQTDEEQCVWHTVFSLGEEPGEGLSFAMRERT